MSNPYPAEFRERALRMLAEARPDHASDFAAASHVAGRLGVNPETLRLWKKRADIDAVRRWACERISSQRSFPERRSRASEPLTDSVGGDETATLTRLRRTAQSFNAFTVFVGGQLAPGIPLIENLSRRQRHRDRRGAPARSGRRIADQNHHENHDPDDEETADNPHPSPAVVSVSPHHDRALLNICAGAPQCRSTGAHHITPAALRRYGLWSPMFDSSPVWSPRRRPQ